MSTARAMVIGYGNTLRHDDGAGYQVAEAVASWNMAAVRSLALHQLTPDLAEPIAQTEIVIFVDAAADIPMVKIERLVPQGNFTFTGHHADPQSLLALAQVLYGAVPVAYQVLIPALQFDFSETLSPLTHNGVAIALERIQQILCASGLELRESYN